MNASPIWLVKEIALKLGHRKYTFIEMIKHLSRIRNPVIVETGCARVKDNFLGDGLSTYIFDQYCQKFKGKLTSIDISEKACAFARSITHSSTTQILQGDSVNVLWNLKQKVDLLYLDSYDLNWENPTPSALHHLKELLAAHSLLKEGTMIVIDDNFKTVGKGMYVKDFFNQVGIKPCFENYQIGWLWTKKAASLNKDSTLL